MHRQGTDSAQEVRDIPITNAEGGVFPEGGTVLKHEVYGQGTPAQPVGHFEWLPVDRAAQERPISQDTGSSGGFMSMWVRHSHAASTAICCRIRWTRSHMGRPFFVIRRSG